MKKTKKIKSQKKFSKESKKEIENYRKKPK